MGSGGTTARYGRRAIAFDAQYAILYRIGGVAALVSSVTYFCAPSRFPSLAAFAAARSGRTQL